MERGESAAEADALQALRVAPRHVRGREAFGVRGFTPAFRGRLLGRLARSSSPCAAFALALLLIGCSRSTPPGVWQGYLEGEYVYIAAPLAGQLVDLHVTRGQTVAVNQALFRLDDTAEAAGLREADSRLAQATNRLANLRKGLRPSELATLEARLARSRANLALAEKELERREKLRADEVIAPTELDASRAQRDAEAAEVRAFTAELETARLGAREDEIRASESEIASLAAARARARWALDHRQQVAPTNAIVHDTLFRAGEFVPAGTPVVALLPPANLKVRFFVPEAELASVPIGGEARLSRDGAPEPIAVSISYVSTQPEFTPPVIYSQESRSKLVYMVEGRIAPEEATRLHPGQPVEVSLAGTRGAEAGSQAR